jgi:hypothetical protein
MSDQFLEELSRSYEIKYRDIMVLDKKTTVRDTRLPKGLITPLLHCDLYLFVMDNGGVECLKDRYDSYGAGTVWFGM